MKMWYIYTTECHSAVRGNVIWSNMDGHRDCHSDWSKSDREGEILYDISYMWNLKRNNTNELIYKTKRVIDVENNLLVNRG